jgi:phenylpropionate dioxygenase-like ring-hydroxylating dioxygenase large terminal subunit
MVCAEGRGNTDRFVCAYHGWSYDRAGALKVVPFESGYEKGNLPKGLKSVPRVSVYRGFIFASLAAQGESLKISWERRKPPSTTSSTARPAASSRSRAASSSTSTTATGS